MTWPDPPLDDHGSDRYDYVELVDAGQIVPQVLWWEELLASACPDCRANLFVRYLGGEPSLGASWHVTVAHDDGCPTGERLVP